MKTKLMALAALSALVLTGCSKEETAIDTLADTPITVTAGINEPGTRAGVVIDNIQTAGFGLYITNPQNDTYSYSDVYMAYDQDNTKWNSYNDNTESKADVTMLWHNSNEAVNVVAFYPYKTLTQDETIYYEGALSTDQSSVENIQASDIMYSTSTVIPSTPDASNDIYYDATHKSLNVKLSHHFAKIKVNILKTGILTENEVVIGVATINALQSGYRFDIHTGTVNPDLATTSFTMFHEQTPVTGYDATYELIALPGQTLGASDNVFSITIDSKTYTCGLAYASAMESGKLYTFNLNAGKERLSVNNVSVNDWTEGTTITGEAE